jgi:predicted amidophosphoribosyltransferase
MVMFFAAAALITIGERLALWPTTAGTCRNCEYDLRGRGSDVCPECGEPI